MKDQNKATRKVQCVKIDEYALAKAIMEQVKHFMVGKPISKNSFGFSAMCNICGSGSTSFCPCHHIVIILQKLSNEIQSCLRRSNS